MPRPGKWQGQTRYVNTRAGGVGPLMYPNVVFYPVSIERTRAIPVIDVVVPGGGITLAVPTVSTVNTALAIAAIKSRTLGIPIVANTALPITTNKSRTLGLVSAANTALPIAAIKSRALALVTELDSARALTGSKRKTVPIVTEVDLALAIIRLGAPATAVAHAHTIILNRYGVY